LLRRAHEAQGNGIWTDLKEDVPVTTDTFSLPDLPVETLPIDDLHVPATPTSPTKLTHVDSGLTMINSRTYQPEEKTIFEKMEQEAEPYGGTSPAHAGVIMERVGGQPRERTSVTVTRLDSHFDGQTRSVDGSMGSEASISSYRSH
jgi:hypothetical protein